LKLNNRSKKSKTTTALKSKPSKLTYKALLGQALHHDVMIEEDKLISEIVYKKYGIKRTRKSRKLSVKLKLKEGETEGMFRSFDVGNMTFWKLGDGLGKNITTTIYESNARKSAAILEEFLLNVCMAKLEHSNRVVIPRRIEIEIYDRHRNGFKNDPVTKKTDLLRYASINDLGWIITENWSFFESTFNKKNNFVTKLNELNDYRRRLAHPNFDPMDPEEMEYFTLAVNIFIKKSHN
jgi:hypothetical protein